ncbi:hypothetical protein [Acidobacterium sp. S8]|uniref:hypothetical protein n=1 Tax=Acidobacterium sp. S8 TaxID=1641854 RepID=UPI00131B2BE0|nr:hypothetical protein [Acidobacterium sp. S8]
MSRPEKHVLFVTARSTKPCNIAVACHNGNLLLNQVHRLNGSKLKAHRPLDCEAQFTLAIQGFAANAYFVIIGDRQAETLDAP